MTLLARRHKMFYVDIDYTADCDEHVINFVNLGAKEGVKVIVEYFKNPWNGWASL